MLGLGALRPSAGARSDSLSSQCDAPSASKGNLFRWQNPSSGTDQVKTLTLLVLTLGTKHACTYVHVLL